VTAARAASGKTIDSVIVLRSAALR
jgi:hypothetical protein